MRLMLTAALVAIALETGLGAQDSLSAAKDLYASAAYEEALSALGRIDGGAVPDVARQVEQYRAFCLFALGRTPEAEAVAESLIRKQPLAALDAADTSPRVESMFAAVRRRLLPTLIREQFRSARTEVDRKNFKTAEPSLTQAHLMIVEAEKLGVKDDGLADLGVLVDGFLQLIRTAAEQAAAPQVVAANAPAAVAAPTRAGAPPAAPAAARPAPVPVAAAPASTRAAVPSSAEPFYSIVDESVSPPVTIDQYIPQMSLEQHKIAQTLKKTAVLDVFIDETGRVTDATIRQSLNEGFDNMLVRSARRWRYAPATRDGIPVRFVKTIVLVP